MLKGLPDGPRELEVGVQRSMQQRRTWWPLRLSQRMAFLSYLLCGSRAVMLNCAPPYPHRVSSHKYEAYPRVGFSNVLSCTISPLLMWPV